MSIIVRTEAEPTGPNIDSLPQLIELLPVAGYAHRWHASSIAVGDNQPISEWADLVGDVPLVGAGPVATTVAGHRVLEFDGVNDFLGVEGLADQQSIVLLCRVLTPTGTAAGILNSPGTALALSRGTSGLTAFNFPTSGVVTITNQLTGWTVVILTYSASSGWLQLNGSSQATTYAGSKTFTSLQLGKNASAFGRIQVAEMTTWTTLLSTPDRTALVAHLQAAYPELFA